ncbi:Uncharacterised protein [Legionella wadsworthii]|uniref:Uncharacterized protein n=1 Tax=Legionella wadsworthii TaxID=28088 RepID=A0A378LRU3_9GAMM|nr:hypothetical protein [Legionella wadsworthii]STY28568.1 Uncharacterised protein [Legionella wadsworthii]
MGKNNKQIVSNGDNHHFGIPEGLVSRRKDEVIAQKKMANLKATNTNNTHCPTPNQAKPLTHLTKSRPKIAHRKPSRALHHLSTSEAGFFSKIEKMVHESSNPEWLKVIQCCISEAWRHYKNYYVRGINTRQPNGWLSWWRHGNEGQERAEIFKKEVEAINNLDQLMKYIGLFFEDPDIRFENHSFASYLFEEFNRLLRGPEYQFKEDTIYCKNDWYQISEQLKMMAEKECLKHSSDLSSTYLGYHAK